MRRTTAALILATVLPLSLLAGCGSTPAPAGGAKSAALETIKFAYLTDANHEAAIWALKHGKVTSDKIKVEAEAMGVPALIQATGTKAYDVVETANTAVPRLLEQGMKIDIAAVALRSHGAGTYVFVRKDSPIKTLADLKGKTLAFEGIASSYATATKVVLNKSYGLNVQENGDVKYQDMPMSNQPAAIYQNKLDAGAYSHVPAYESRSNPDLRVVTTMGDEWKKLTGQDYYVTAVLVVYPEKAQARTEAYKEFFRLLRASRQYLNDHGDEVFAAVADEQHTKKEALADWYKTQNDFPATLNDTDLKALDKLWELAKEVGLLKTAPKAADVVWKDGVSS